MLTVNSLTMTDSFHLEILPDEQLRLLELLSGESFIRDFYLAGGTCLALYLGHRQSYDFDFFIPEDFDTSLIINNLTRIGRYERDNEDKNTINGTLDNVRISFFGYKYDIIDDFSLLKGIRLAGIRDIAAMKLEQLQAEEAGKTSLTCFFC